MSRSILNLSGSDRAGGAHLARLRVISTACVPNLGEITKISGAAALNVTILRFISSSELFIAA